MVVRHNSDLYVKFDNFWPKNVKHYPVYYNCIVLFSTFYNDFYNDFPKAPIYHPLTQWELVNLLAFSSIISILQVPLWCKPQSVVPTFMMYFQANIPSFLSSAFCPHGAEVLCVKSVLGNL